MKYRILILFFILYLSIMFYNCSMGIGCKEDINLLPMYGRVQKCKSQLDADEKFLNSSSKEEPDRAKAAIKVMDSGWYYLHQGDYNTAMKRINQAWLLDSTNIAIYASFAVILDITQKTDDAIKMLDLTFDKIKARKDPENPTPINPSNEVFVEFIVKNAPFTYKKTNNSIVSEYLYKKLNTISISDSNKQKLQNELMIGIPKI